MGRIIAVTGYKGRIGSQLVKRGYTPLDCDITDFEQVRDTVSKVNPDVIIHCAALTDVGYCERSKENEKEAFKVNVRGTANLLEGFEGTFIYLSTVHVFNGEKYFDYSEKHKPDPVNAYGYSKWAGEIAADAFAENLIILRISKAFDYEWMRYPIESWNIINYELDVPTFIKRSFVYTPHLAEGIGWVAENLLDVKLLNVSGTDTLSYYDFWMQAANVLGLDKKRIIPRKHTISDQTTATIAASVGVTNPNIIPPMMKTTVNSDSKEFLNAFNTFRILTFSPDGGCFCMRAVR